jgi:hypothetical protein
MQILAVRHAPDSGIKTEVEIAATAEELIRLAEALTANESEEAAAPDAGRRAGGEMLSGVKIQRTPGRPVLISVDWDNHVLQVTGGHAQMDVFASEIRGIAEETAVGHHQHFDYFPDHFYLDSKTLSLAVQLV